jgi:mRNA-degrading endonuclease RelE of RelBE toxin-antitoxin system
LAIESVQFTARFQKEYKALTNDLRAEVDEALRDLLKNPIPLNRRFHSLSGYRNPKLYTIDVTVNRAYKISLELDGTLATLRRVATHKQIDRKP